MKHVYTIICQHGIADDGFELTESNFRRACRIAREHVETSYRNAAQATVARATGSERPPLITLAKYINVRGRAHKCGNY